ncbi:hypothetical protein SAMD00019534_041990, partial [Acytostelium subglobosum LB1]|uniref:hypothetical protein n=1 Tax=Acytostelium subglobosum LB1 TaxID=1410327 RepID=UPI0006450D5F
PFIQSDIHIQSDRDKDKDKEMNIFSSLMKPKNKFSLENLKYLYTTLVKNPVITPSNSGVIVETLRQIAEVLIWGDQNNNSLFEFFQERNLLGFFVSILDQKTSSSVTIQLLQTLSILVENLRTQYSIYYLLSNNYINEIIVHKYDFSCEEVLEFYISFLKALSLKLDKNTINFFFNDADKDFPLYTEAIKFVNHKETMIRIAVRTLTLNVFKVQDEPMRSYIIKSTAVPYFSNIVWFIRKECANLNRVLLRTTFDRVAHLNYCYEELTDQFYYLHDIFNLGFESINMVLAEQFIQYLIFPLLIGSVIDSGPGLGSGSVSGVLTLEDRLEPSLALFLLTQVFHIFTYEPLLDTVASAIAASSASPSLLMSASLSAPPPLSMLSSQRRRYDSFKRFSSFPNLGNLLNNQPPVSPSKRKSFSLRKSLSTLTLEKFGINQMHQSQQLLPSPPMVDTTDAEQAQDKTLVSPDSSSPAQTTTTAPATPPEPASAPKEPWTLMDDGGEDELDSSLSTPRGEALVGMSNDFAQRLRCELSSSIDSESTIMSGDNNSSKYDSLKKYGSNKNEFKETLIDLIRNDNETYTVICMLYSLLKNNKVDRKILQSGGLLPYHLAKAKKLLEGLLSPDTLSTTAAKAAMSKSLPNISSHYRSRSESHTRLVSMFNDDDAPATQQEEANNREEILSVLALLKRQHQQMNGGAMDQPFISTTIFKSRVNNNDDSSSNGGDDQFVPVPDSSQTDFTRNLIDMLFLVLVNSNQYRVVTLQMTLLLLKELVYSPESPSKLTENQHALLEEAYRMTTNNLKDCLSLGNIASVFLELFEDELRTYRQIDFDALMNDIDLLLPVPDTPVPRLPLSRRLPSGDQERTQRAIQQFLVLRELKYTLLRRKDSMLPLKQPQVPMVREKDLFNLNTELFDIIHYYQVVPQQSVGQQPSSAKTKVRKCAVLFHHMLLDVDPNNVVTPPNKRSGVYGVITHIAPLQRLEIETSHLDPTILRVFSHPTRWNVDMGFDDETKCQQVKSLLTTARDDIRSIKMRQIYSLLGERDPYDDDGDQQEQEATATNRVIVPIDASNSHPLAFLGNQDNTNNEDEGSVGGDDGHLEPNLLTERKAGPNFTSFLNDDTGDDELLQKYRELSRISDDTLLSNRGVDGNTLLHTLIPTGIACKASEDLVVNSNLKENLIIIKKEELYSIGLSSGGGVDHGRH